MKGLRLAPGEVGEVQYGRKPNGRHVARVLFRDHHGKVRRVQMSGDSKSAARRKALAAVERELQAGGLGDYSTRTTFGEVAEDWYREIADLVEGGQRSPSTLGLYRHVLDRHVLPALGELRLGELSPARIDHFLQQKRRTSGYSTAKLCRSVASGVCRLAVRRDALRSNPVRDVSTLEKRGGKEARALTPAECTEWLAVLDENELSVRKDLPDLTRFMLGTGCRLGEAVGVHWEDLDLDRHLLHVQRTVLRVKGRGLVAKRPKTRSGERILRIPFWLVKLLRQRKIRAAVTTGPVFPDARGGYRDRNNVEADYRKVRAGTKFDWVVPHVYRKTVATMLDQGGVSARMIADQLGHSRISMTQDVYMGRRAVDCSVASALDLLFPAGPDDDGPQSGSLTVVS